ncbi:MAG: Crp/Fnr family transcriptional regulator [Bacteroidota bacterium]
MLNNNTKVKCGLCIHQQQCFFNSLNDTEHDIIDKNKTEVFYKAGETIYKQGTSSNYLVFLLSGMVKVMIEGDHDKNLVLRLGKPFQILDFPAIFDDNMLYRSCVTVVDSRACLIDIDVFKSILLSNKKYVPLLFSHLNKTQNIYSKRLINLIYKNMEARIADALLYLVNEVYYSRVFTLTISRKDLAELAGMSRESTSRILRQFKEQDLLRIRGKEIEILNKKGLEYLSAVG